MSRHKEAIIKWSDDGCYASVIDKRGNELERFDDEVEASNWCEDCGYKVVKIC